MDDLNILLTHHTLFIDNKYEDIASLFCNTSGFDKTKTKNRYLLPTWYDGYIYTSLLGIITNNREKYSKKVEKTRTWSSNYLDQYKYVIANLLSRKDILNELKILNYEDLFNDNFKIENTIDEIKNICDEFSIGGLKYLSELYENDNSIFSDYDSLIKIFIEAKEK